MELRYRLQQFQQNILARPLPQEAWGVITAVLSSAEQQLFRRFSPSDQWHSYRVAAMLQAAGQTHPDLLVAALLHDVGKTRIPISVIERSLIVLAQWLFPKRVAQWGAGEPVGWKRPFVVKMQHPEWGARMVAEVSSRPLAVSLIRRHQDTLLEVNNEEDRLLQLLQWADDQN